MVDDRAHQSAEVADFVVVGTGSAGSVVAEGLSADSKQVVAVLEAGGMDNDRRTADVTLTNAGNSLAFFIEMKIVGKKSQRSLTPVFWDDNYISLPPHATRTFHTEFPKGEKPELELQGWNVKAQVLK